MATPNPSQRAQAETYLQSLTRALEFAFGLAVYRAMTVDGPLPKRPKGLGLRRAVQIRDSIGDIVDWWR